MTTITSPQNPRLQELRRLQRRRERTRSGHFVAEGEDLLAAAADAGWKPVEGYRVAGSALGGVRVRRRGPGGAGGGRHARLGNARDRRVRAALESTPAGPLCVYLHGLSDPGNVGAVLRAATRSVPRAWRSGPDCADPWSPKAVRASMGAIFHVDVARVESIAELPPERIALVPTPGPPAQPLSGPVPGPITLLVGAEREGLPAELVAACERSRTSPSQTIR